MRVFLREILGPILLAVIIFLILQATMQSFVVVGSSMKPSLYDGQRLLINKVVYSLHEPEVGDVVVFEPPNNQRADYIKRIIALPGDIVEVKMGVVYVNGSPLDERTYIKELPRYSLPQQKIPENEYFVLGDNRPVADDSHHGWTVKREDIIGKAWLSIWPPSRWGLAPNYSFQDCAKLKAKNS